MQILAAENFYGDIAKEIGGDYVNVQSILMNPDQDPHLFNLPPSVARDIFKADIIIYNGIHYDPWMNSLLAMEKNPHKKIINVAALMHLKEGDNPHIWFLPDTMPKLAKELTSILIAMDPLHTIYYEKRLSQFNRKYKRIYKKMADIQKQFKNRPVIATEPIFGYMVNSLGLTMFGLKFQLNMMNDIPPTVSQIQEFENALNERSVDVLIYNKQIINPLTLKIKKLADQNQIPIVGITEMLPAQLNYIDWIVNQLSALEEALKSRGKRHVE